MFPRGAAARLLLALLPLLGSGSSSRLCLSEDCVLASAAILTSMDRSVDPCHDFYSFACGGWRQRSVVTNTDQFAAIDKRNQNIIHKALSSQEDDSFDNNDTESHNNNNNNNNVYNVSAEWKARRFYASCLRSEGVSQVSEDTSSLNVLQDVVALVGGWDLSGLERQMDFDTRLRTIHNRLGLNAFFTWGVIEHEGADALAIIAGGWNDALLGHGDDDDDQDYLKLMSMYTLLLAQNAEQIDAQIVKADDNEEEADDTEMDAEIEVDYGDYNLSEGESKSDALLYDEYNTLDYYGGDANVVAPISKLWKMLSGGNVEVKEEERAAANETEAANAIEIDEVSKDIEHPEDQDVLGPTLNHSLSNLHFLGVDSEALPEGFESELSAMLARNARIESAMRKVIVFERRLAAIASKPVDSNNLVNMSVAEMSLHFDFVDWTTFFEHAFNLHARERVNVTEVSRQHVLVQRDFLVGLGSLLSEYTNSSTLIHYMVWRVLAAFYPDRPLDEMARRERCLKETEEMFAPAITALFIRAMGVTRAEEVVQQVEDMVDSMKDAFHANLADLPWMSAASRASAGRKLDQMVDLIGYPRFVLNVTWMGHVYNELAISETDYVTNIVAYRAFVRRSEVRRYLSDLELEGEWSELSHLAHISTVNAFYNQASNTMVVPIGMLQPPLYWQRPKALTFGAFGIVVAHEVTHAFDDMGIQYDASGSFRPLYDPKTSLAFRKASECVREQYSLFEILDDVFVDGNSTLGENLADLGGLIIAEKAFDSFKAKNKQSFSLPALQHFTDDQLFYLGYALPWCALHTDHVLRTHIVVDEHAPERFRVIGPLANSRKFADAFQCPLGTNMNPRHKCQIWSNN